MNATNLSLSPTIWSFSLVLSDWSLGSSLGLLGAPDRLAGECDWLLYDMTTVWRERRASMKLKANDLHPSHLARDDRPIKSNLQVPHLKRKPAAMPRNSAGSKGTSRVSITSLEGLRCVLRKDPERTAAAVVADDKKTMQGLNERLSGFLDRVRRLEEDNQEVQGHIDETLARRGEPDGRGWDDIEKPLADLRRKARLMMAEYHSILGPALCLLLRTDYAQIGRVKEITKHNAELLLLIHNTKLANDDIQNNLEAENLSCRSAERDLIGLKKTIEDTQLHRLQLESQVESVKEELAVLKKDHQDEVEALRQKIRDSNVEVEVDSQETNLAETLSKIREQYENLAKNNQEEADNWYQSKFENIKVEEAQNTGALQSGKLKLKDLHRQKQLLEIDNQSMLSMIRSLEETLNDTEERYSSELSRLRCILIDLEVELCQLRGRVERQVDAHQDLLHVKLRLEAEIENYRQLLHSIASDEDSSEFELQQALNSEQAQPDQEGGGGEGRGADKQEATLTNQAPPLATDDGKKPDDVTLKLEFSAEPDNALMETSFSKKENEKNGQSA
ncbi:Keratin, type I cytoskeletal 18 [Merluccius polli]|uniref:Keratin, type I cytoskeletal 18 n=1 Tax=Merluccius polli TaxID=89951 RepID=A0AA47NRH5_MERPO|nr:Keratin, type I cytoskeletal 18 [Merluccius polli]